MNCAIFRLFQKGIISASLLACWVLSAPADAAIFVKIEGIPGPETVRGEAGFHKALSWSWGETNGGSSAPGGGLYLNDFSLVVPSGRATPRLFALLCDGSVIPTVKVVSLVERPPGGETRHCYASYELENVLISSYSVSGGSADVPPAAEVALNFTKIEFEFGELLGDGSVRNVVTRECTNPARPSK